MGHGKEAFNWKGVAKDFLWRQGGILGSGVRGEPWEGGGLVRGKGFVLSEREPGEEAHFLEGI